MKRILVNKSLFFTFILTLSVIPLTNSYADYVAYAVEKNGREKHLPENIDNIKAKDLLKIKWGEYSGKKARVGVLEIENNTNVATVQIYGLNGSSNELRLWNGRDPSPGY